MGRLGILILALIAGLAIGLYINWLALQGTHIVYASESATRGLWGRRVRAMLDARRFDELQALVDSVERVDARWPGGTRYRDTFYSRGFREVNDPKDPAAWEVHLARTREWMDARPTSVAPRFALAEALVARAWAARGEGYAATVSEGQWRRFHADLEEAGALLRQVPASAQDAIEWRLVMMLILHGTGEDSLYRELAHSTIRRHPYELRPYVDVSFHLMPRWFGVAGEWEQFAARATSTLPDSIRDEYYARIIEGQNWYMDSAFDDSLLSWERTQRGVLDWHRHWPASTEALSAGARLGTLAGDRDFTRRCFASLADTFNTDVWLNLKQYLAARTWAEQDTGRP